MVDAERVSYRNPPAPDKFQAGFDTYLSTYTYRYGSSEMRQIWSRTRFWGNVRDVWIAVAQTQMEAGIVTPEQVNDLRMQRDNLSVERIDQLEREQGHDVAAAIKEYSEVAQEGGKILHIGLTSEDVLSNAEIKQIHEAFAVIRPKLVGVLSGFAGQIKKHNSTIAMGFTHLQAAEPIPYASRFAKYAQDLVEDLGLLDYIKLRIKGKGIKGPVGTSASVEEALSDTGMTVEEHEREVMEKLGIDYSLVADQTYPRKYLFLTETVLASIAQSLHRFALDVQILQSSPFGEVSEPRGRRQIGSSAMPWKQNPIHSENIDSLTETLSGEVVKAWITGAFVTLERTLRDSAGKREWLPQGFLAIDEALTRAERVVKGLEIHKNAVNANFERFAPFAACEIILDRLVTAGMDRKAAHEILYEHAQLAVDDIRSGKPNAIKDKILSDQQIRSYLGEKSITSAFEDIYHHVGNALEQNEKFLQTVLYPVIKMI